MRTMPPLLSETEAASPLKDAGLRHVRRLLQAKGSFKIGSTMGSIVGSHRSRDPLLLPLVCHEEELGARLRLELRRAVLAADVVTDPQRVAVQLVNGRNRPAFVWA